MAYLEELLPEFRKGAKIRLSFWEKNQYLCYDAEQNIVNNKGENTDIVNVSYLSSDKWELYQHPEPNWDYIIKNKCLCWFWFDANDDKYLGTIRYINKNDQLPFMNWERGYAKNCRPVRRHEVTFYEDKKDE